ncbi:hypothetical protein JCM9534A_70710 [Catenuloplanes indicus JCM 9534]
MASRLVARCARATVTAVPPRRARRSGRAARPPHRQESAIFHRPGSKPVLPFPDSGNGNAGGKISIRCARAEIIAGTVRLIAIYSYALHAMQARAKDAFGESES